jgi:hypothetical protein
MPNSPQSVPLMSDQDYELGRGLPAYEEALANSAILNNPPSNGQDVLPKIEVRKSKLEIKPNDNFTLER